MPPVRSGTKKGNAVTVFTNLVSFKGDLDPDFTANGFVLQRR